jgi:hypothetical protein
MQRASVIIVALIGIIGGLMLVGVVSHTPLRHLVQVAPAGLVLVLIGRGFAWADDAALPVFSFWFLIMLGIWLYLLGVARIITGRFSPVEVVLTILVGLSCVVGLVAVLSAPPRPRRVLRLVVALGFAALQVAAMWFSLRPLLADA